MTLSSAAKIGGGLLATAAVPATVYAASDHIFLYSVEREVISKDLKLTITGPTDKKITITAPSSSTGNDPKLDEGHSWTCEITITSSSADSSWKTKLEKNLFSSTATSSITDLQRKNKELLVRACAKDRDIETKTNETVKGKLIAKEEETSGTKKFLFEQNPELDSLLEDSSK